MSSDCRPSGRSARQPVPPGTRRAGIRHPAHWGETRGKADLSPSRGHGCTHGGMISVDEPGWQDRIDKTNFLCYKLKKSALVCSRGGVSMRSVDTVAAAIAEKPHSFD